MRNKMSMSEAGKLGSIASRETQQKQKQKRIEEYRKNPKLCLFCQNSLEYKNHKQKNFCSSSCSASYNNSRRKIVRVKKTLKIVRVKKTKKIVQTKNDKVITTKKITVCTFCGNVCKKNADKYCTLNCLQQHKWFERKEKIENEQKVTNARQARRYLLETQGHKCAIPHCGISEWHGQPVLLICDHINGNADDWSLTNLRMICSNCDAQTPFYKGKNKGNGRHKRRLRYKNGLSF